MITVPPHAHNDDLRVLVLDRGVTVKVDDCRGHYRVGRHVELPAHRVHAEQFDEGGYTYLPGRRHTPYPALRNRFAAQH